MQEAFVPVLASDAPCRTISLLPGALVFDLHADFRGRAGISEIRS